MSYLLPVVWIKYDMMFPSMVQTKDSRLNELVMLLIRAVPDPVDAMGMLLSYSHKHISLSQKIGTTGHPLHLFMFDEESWRNLLGFLGAILSVKGRIYSSASQLAEPAPKRAAAATATTTAEGVKVVSVPPGSTKEQTDKLIAEAQAGLRPPKAPRPPLSEEAAAAETTPTSTPPPPIINTFA